MRAAVGEGLHVCGGGKENVAAFFSFWSNRVDGGAKLVYWAQSLHRPGNKASGQMR
jgi:hypothetical protein